MTQPTDAQRAFRGCQRGGARKFSLLMVMCDWLMKMKNQDTAVFNKSAKYLTALLKVCSKEPPRMGSKRYKNKKYREGKNHQHLRDFDCNTHIHFLSHVSLTFDLICIIIPFITHFSVTVPFCHSPEVAPLQWQLLSSAVTSCLTSL